MKKRLTLIISINKKLNFLDFQDTEIEYYLINRNRPILRFWMFDAFDGFAPKYDLAS
jgi:hypothetical protein